MNGPEGASAAPSSILNVLLAKFIKEGRSRTTTASSPLPVVSPTMPPSLRPTRTGTIPVGSDQHDGEEQQQEMVTTTSRPTGEINLVDKRNSDIVDQNAIERGSIGYEKRCDGHEFGPTDFQEGLIFTYLAESKQSDIEFLTELEIHILNHAALHSLRCDGETSTNNNNNATISITRLKYSDEEAASEASVCEPQHASSKSCWILRTRMLIVSDKPSAAHAKFFVLSEIQNLMNGGELLTNTFPDLSFTQYLGPDPVNPNGGNINADDSPSFPTLSPTVMVGLQEREQQQLRRRGPVFIATLVSISVANVVLALVFYFLVVCKRRRNGKNTADDTQSLDEVDSESSIEISELLSKSRQRLEEFPIKDDELMIEFDEVVTVKDKDGLRREYNSRGEKPPSSLETDSNRSRSTRSESKSSRGTRPRQSSSRHSSSSSSSNLDRSSSRRTTSSSSSSRRDPKASSSSSRRDPKASSSSSSSSSRRDPKAPSSSSSHRRRDEETRPKREGRSPEENRGEKQRPDSRQRTLRRENSERSTRDEKETFEDEPSPVPRSSSRSSPRSSSSSRRRRPGESSSSSRQTTSRSSSRSGSGESPRRSHSSRRSEESSTRRREERKDRPEAPRSTSQPRQQQEIETNKLGEATNLGDVQLV